MMCADADAYGEKKLYGSSPVLAFNVLATLLSVKFPGDTMLSPASEFLHP